MQTQLSNRQEPAKRTWKIWWELIRPHTLTASFVPVTLGTVLALKAGKANFALFTAMMAASILIQSATNLFNEYYDFKRGLDNEHSVGIGGGIVRHGMTPGFILKLALFLYALAVILGVYICEASTWWLAVLGLVSMAVGYLYTGGPLPLSYTPFGELFSGLFLGFLVILIAFFIQTGDVTLEVVLLSIPSGILVSLINLSNNIRDHNGDKANGRKTLAVLLGPPKAVIFMGVMFGFVYLWTVGLVALGIASPWILLAFLSLPKAIRATRGFVGKSEPITMMPAMKATGQTNTIYGLLMALGLLIGHVI